MEYGPCGPGRFQRSIASGALASFKGRWRRSLGEFDLDHRDFDW